MKPWPLLKQYGWLLLLSSLLMGALIIMSQILQNASRFAEAYIPLLLFTLAGILLLLIVLFRTFYTLYRHYKSQATGIRLTLKLTSYVTLLVGIPVVTIYLFSLNFIYQGIDQWFDVKTDKALSEAIKLVQANLDDKTRDKLHQTEAVAAEKRNELVQFPAGTLNSLLQTLDAQTVALYKANGQLIAFSSQASDTTASPILPEKPEESAFQQIRLGHPFANLKTIPGGTTAQSIIEVLIPIKGTPPQIQYALHATFDIPDNLTQLASTVQLAASQYNELSYLQNPLKNSFTLVLTLLILLTLATSILFTLKAVQNFTRPIRTLTRGTQAIAKGDYSLTMPVIGKDELGQLIASFNEMIQKISRARNELKYSHQQTEVQKLYLQAIIKNLSSGVLTLDAHHRIRTTNTKLDEILNIQSQLHIGKPLEEMPLIKNSAHLAPLIQHIQTHFQLHPDRWQEQIQFNCKKGEKTLLIHGSTLPSLDQQVGGYVIVIDDVTELVQAQRHAAWSDVARRLAHEIKNPLTPIQLSAERLAYKLSAKLPPEEAQLLQRLTHTIIEQVQAMQSLVQAFSEYANTPELNLQPINLHPLLNNIAEMYHSPEAHCQIQTHFTDHSLYLQADPHRLRQLFHNLFKNALEALKDYPEQTHPTITLSTQQIDGEILIAFCDNGPGIEEEAINWIFEPYATDKPKGTGLGLAVVKKVVEEHNGTIAIETSEEGGVCFNITFPAITDLSEMTPDD